MRLAVEPLTVGGSGSAVRFTRALGRGLTSLIGNTGRKRGLVLQFDRLPPALLLPVLREVGRVNAKAARPEAVLAWVPLRGGTTAAGFSAEDYIESIVTNNSRSGAARALQDPGRLIARMRRRDSTYDARYLPGTRELVAVCALACG